MDRGHSPHILHNVQGGSFTWAKLNEVHVVIFAIHVLHFKSKSDKIYNYLTMYYNARLKELHIEMLAARSSNDTSDLGNYSVLLSLLYELKKEVCGTTAWCQN